MRGATFLKIAAGPRASAMGEAQVAVVNDAYTSYWNPAALGRIKQTEIAMMYQRSFQGIQEHNIGFTFPLTQRTSLGAYATQFAVEPFSRFDANGNHIGETDSSEGAYGVAYGIRVIRYFYIGGGFKLLRSSLGPSSASSHAGDIGTLIRIPFPKKDSLKHHLNFGFSAKNLGPALVYDNEKTRLPQTNSLGLGLETPLRSHGLVVAVDYNFSADHPSYFTMGHEILFKRTLAMRAGYRFGKDQEQGFRAGIGIRLKSVRLSYSISPFGFLGEAHRFGISYRFNPPNRMVWVPIPEGPSKMENWVEPKTMTVPNDDPESPDIIPQPVDEKGKSGLTPKGKKKIAPKKKGKKGPSPKPIEKTDLPNDVPGLMKLGNQYLKEGRFNEATSAFGKALKIEPNNTKALELMRKALNELDRKKRRERGIYE